MKKIDVINNTKWWFKQDFNQWLSFWEYIWLSYFEKMLWVSFELDKQFLRSKSPKQSDNFFNYFYVRNDNDLTSPLTNLEFILKNEEKNFLKLDKDNLIKIFNSIDTNELITFINEKSKSKFRRKIWYYYEQYTWKELDIDKLDSSTNYEKLLDEESFITKPKEYSVKNDKFKILDNNLWNILKFNPIVERNEIVDNILNKDINKKIDSTLSNYSEKVIKNAINFLYLKETKWSLWIEEEIFDDTKNRWFLELIKNIPIENSLNKEWLLKYYDVIFWSQDKSEEYRDDQNYIWSLVRWQEIIDYIPPKPKDVNNLMWELMDFYNESKKFLNPVILSSIVSTQFVYIHPFWDWNWRTSRFLIHYCLHNTWIWNDLNIILPLSAYILTHRDEYYENLEKVSKKMKNKVNYVLKWDNKFCLDIEVKWETKNIYDKINFTEIVEYYDKIIEKSIEKEFKEELDYLNKFYQLYDVIDQKVNIWRKELNAFINFYIQWNWEVSKNKLKLLENRLGIKGEKINEIIELLNKNNL